jgi:starch phosphorylase
MKAALNGALNLSIRDGWWDEWFDGGNGWAIPSAVGVEDPERRDLIEATAMYDLIANQVIQRFYDRDGSGVPRRWVDMVRHTLTTLGPKVLATRMVAEYVRRLYAPAAVSSERVRAGGYAAARELAAWRERVLQAWPGVRVIYVDSQLAGAAQIGSVLTLRAEVALNGLSPDDVEVAAVYGTVDLDDRLTAPETMSLKVVESIDGTTRFEGDIPLERTGSFGYTVRVLPKNAALASSAELGVVAVA